MAAPEMRRGPQAPEKVSAERKATAPVTRVKSAGRINKRLEQLADLYTAKHPGRIVRWVYDPQHKPDMSNVLSRQIDGYEVILVKDLGDAVALPGMKPDEPARVGDTIMMSIAEDVVKGMRADLDKAASDEMTRVEQEFHTSIEEVSHVKGGKEYHTRPMGRSLIEEVERDVEGPDSHKESQD